MQKSLPDAADEPALCESRIIDFALQMPTERQHGAHDVAADPPLSNQEKLREYFGLQLAEDGLLQERDVTVQFVDPKGLAQRVRRWQDVGKRMRAGDIRQQMLFAPPAAVEEGHASAGLRVGDVIEAIDDDPVPTDVSARQWVIDRLVARAVTHWAALQQGEDPQPPLRLRVRRGLPHPYAGHPSLDLFVGVDESAPGGRVRLHGLSRRAGECH